MISLQARMLIAVALVSISFLTITGFVLYEVFSKQVRKSTYDRLVGYSDEIYNKSVDSEEGGKVDDSSDEDEDESDLPPVLNDNEIEKQTALSKNNNESEVKNPKKFNSNSNLLVKSGEVNVSGIVVFKARKGVDIEERKKEYASKQAIGIPTGFFRELSFYEKDSGLYARIIDYNNKILWATDSLIDLSVPFNSKSKAGSYSFTILQDRGGKKYFALNFTVIQEKRMGEKIVEQKYMFQLTESLDRLYYAQVGGFRVKLIQWLTALTVTLLLSLVIVLRWWGLGPMHKVSKELEDIKMGKAKNLSGPYPKELRGLTDGIKTLIVSERAQQERYRNSLGDLAHSLKTPLAVLSGSTEQDSIDSHEMKSNIRDQVDRMSQIIDYQLQRAAASGRTTLMTPVAVRKTTLRIVNTLKKAYADKDIKFSCDIDEKETFIGDEGDLLELIGNIMDNACKLCVQEVKISGVTEERNTKSTLVIHIEDDGPGIPKEKIQGVLKRGFRADQSTSGQGIGLAVVKEIVHAYKGELTIGQSSLGGAKFSIFFLM